jgi:hypothetical protein
VVTSGSENQLLGIIQQTLVNLDPNNRVGLIQAGDYAWISPSGKDPHGLLVAGWGPIRNCGDIIEHPAGGQRVALGDGQLFPTYEAAVSAGITYPTPYLVDFSYRVQHPIPRPFYCTQYRTTSTGGWTTFAIHDWYFFTMPDTVNIPSTSLHVRPDWQWEQNDGTVTN